MPLNLIYYLFSDHATIHAIFNQQKPIKTVMVDKIILKTNTTVNKSKHSFYSSNIGLYFIFIEDLCWLRYSKNTKGKPLFESVNNSVKPFWVKADNIDF